MVEETGIRKGSSPDFCPPVEEGMTISFEDDKGAVTDFEFLGLVLMDGSRFGFFFPLDDGRHPLDSGEVVVLEAVGFDDEGQPSEFELVDDADRAERAYSRFVEATKDIYRFE